MVWLGIVGDLLLEELQAKKTNKKKKLMRSLYGATHTASLGTYC